MTLRLFVLLLAVSAASVVRAPPASAQVNRSVRVVPYGTGGYRYYVAATTADAPPPDWYATAFDDSRWAVARGPLASDAGAVCHPPALTSPWARGTHVYVRLHAPRPAECVLADARTLSISVTYTATIDGVFVNGTAFPRFTPATQTCLPSSFSIPAGVPIVSTMENLIAVHLHSDPGMASFYDHQVDLGYPSCGSSTRCNPATNSCQPPCTAASDCPPATLCDSLTQSCVACNLTHACPSGQRCSPDGRCIECLPGAPDHCAGAPAGSACLVYGACGCYTDADCGGPGAGRACVARTGGLAGTCIAGCYTDATCPAGQRCTPVAGPSMPGHCIPTTAMDGGAPDATATDAATTTDRGSGITDLGVTDLGYGDAGSPDVTALDASLAADLGAAIDVATSDVPAVDVPTDTRGDVAMVPTTGTDAAPAGAGPLDLRGGAGCTVGIAASTTVPGWVVVMGLGIAARGRRGRRGRGRSHGTSAGMPGWPQSGRSRQP